MTNNDGCSYITHKTNLVGLAREVLNEIVTGHGASKPKSNLENNDMATKQESAGQWKSLTGAVKQKYGQITEDELTQLNGNVDQLIGLVQRKSGQTREQIEAFVHKCGESCDSVMDRASDYVSDASESLQAGYDVVAEQTKRGYDASARTVASHPFETIGAAFGVGMVAGLLIGLSMGAQRERDLSWRERWMN